MADDERRAYVREWTRNARANETPEQAEKRRAQARGYAAKRQAKMRAEGTSLHGKRMAEDPEYRAKRAEYARRAYEKKRGMDWAPQNRLYKFKLTPERYAQMLDEQGGACAICRRADAKLHVDHDHSCCPGAKSCGGCVRALLCPGCNGLLGAIDDGRRDLSPYLAYVAAHSAGGTIAVQA